jgi:hypothetical protein
VQTEIVERGSRFALAFSLNTISPRSDLGKYFVGVDCLVPI